LGASTRGESGIATVLLGVVELWLSQGGPKTARTGVSAPATLICVPGQVFAENSLNRGQTR